MDKKKSAIKIKLKRYSYEYEGGYTGDAIITEQTADSVVTILDLTKTFKHDPYLHAAKDWVNNTFAKEKVDELNAAKTMAQQQIKELLAKIKAADLLLNDFLVPVEIEE